MSVFITRPLQTHPVFIKEVHVGFGLVIALIANGIGIEKTAPLKQGNELTQTVK